MLNVSFHPSEIGKQLDLIYIRFKRGARRELTPIARVRQASSILPDALVRDVRSRTGRETVSKRALRDRLCVNGSSVRRGRCAVWGGASMRSIQRHEDL